MAPGRWPDAERLQSSFLHHPCGLPASCSAFMSFPRKPFTGRHGPILLAMAMLVITLGLTAVLSRNAQNVVARNVRADFDFRVRETVERIQQRMDTYQQVLRGMRGFLQGSVTPQRA